MSRRLETTSGFGTSINGTVPLTITVGGTPVVAFEGDTVASALVAAGRLETAPSMYLQRPRGIMAAGVEEPNGLLTVKAAGDWDIDETMLPVTTVAARDGLEAEYVQGQGALDPTPDPARYDHVYRHADVLIVGAGPAGIAAAQAALAGDSRVILMDEQPLPGGSLLSARGISIDGASGAQWAASTLKTLQKNEDFLYLPRTTAFGSYDSNFVIGVERCTTHLAHRPDAGVPRERLWHVRAHQVVLATGALERPLVFKNNDRPGIMLAGAVRTYLNRYAALAGDNVALFTTNDSAYELLGDLIEAGAQVAVVVDARPGISPAAQAKAEALGIRVLTGAAVFDTDGAGHAGRISAVHVGEVGADGFRVGELETIPCDLLAVSGGWNPNVNLHTQRQGATHWDSTIAACVPSAAVAGHHLAGALTGEFSTQAALTQGARAGREAREAAAHTAGFEAGETTEKLAVCEGEEFALDAAPVRALWCVAHPDGADGSVSEHFVDFQRDQSVADIARAFDAGMTSVEHIKRYTSIGTANDQGKTSSVNTMAILAAQLGEANLDEVGVSRYRPPYTPVAFATLAGRRRGDLFDPARLSSIHPWHMAHGAKFEDVGQWKRPWFYPQDGEDMDAAVLRECTAARSSVAFMDGSTLGKIEIRGKDAGEFLNRIYTNGFKLLKPGKIRYGVMCTHDGMIFDDGVTMRLAEDRFLMTTTSSGAAKVLDWLEDWSQTEWPDLDVTLTSVTEQYATITVVGPKSRAVIQKVAPDLDASNEAFGFMEFRECTLSSGIPARICRISFSGELAYEINVDTFYGLAVWEAVAAAGEEFSITPYGTETMHVLRAEKGFIIVGQDTDGTVTPQDAGMSWVVSKKKNDFIGMRSFARPDTMREDRKHLVSLIPTDKRTRLREGAQLIKVGVDPTPAQGTVEAPLAPGAGQVHSEGWVTSSYLSAELGHPFALALVEGGRNRVGEILVSPNGVELIEVEIGELCLVDPEGKRRDG